MPNKKQAIVRYEVACVNPREKTSIRTGQLALAYQGRSDICFEMYGLEI
jgi:hypothetical protein